MSAYKAVRDGPRAVMRALDGWPVDKDSYYAVRALEPTNRFEHAAQFIYLNKVGWNGLYRVNLSGKFNVPYGRPKSSNVADAVNLVRCAATLRGRARLQVADFEASVDDCKRGDLVFFDPPYVTGHSNNGFVDYNEKLLSWDDQERMARLAERPGREGDRHRHER